MLSAFGLALSAAVTPEQHGAAGDGVADDTDAVRAALAACQGAPPCTVVFAAKYLTGPLVVDASVPTTLEVTGSITALPRVEGCTSRAGGRKCYPRDAQAQAAHPAFVVVRGAGSFVLRGGGRIDGRGEAWWPCKHTGCWRPELLIVEGVAGVRIEDVTLLDSPNHFVELVNCSGVRVQRLTALAPHSSPNTDGINFVGGRDQLLSNCTFSNGDDCMSVVTATPSGVNCSVTPGECRGGNLIAEDVRCIGGHGASIVSVRNGFVSNVTFRRILLTGSEHQGLESGGGCRIKTYPRGVGGVSDVMYDDILIDGVAYPVQILAEYCPISQRPYPCPQGDTAINVSGITFSNIRGTGRGLTGVVGIFDCGDVVPCRGIRLQNITLTDAASRHPRFKCSNASGTAEAVSPPSCLGG